MYIVLYPSVSFVLSSLYEDITMELVSIEFSYLCEINFKKIILVYVFRKKKDLLCTLY